MDARDPADPVRDPPAGRWVTSSCIDLSELEIEDGPGMATLVTRLREVAHRRGGLCLRHCPQMLAHTLYKVGMLQDGRLQLVAPRVESPTVA